MATTLPAATRRDDPPATPHGEPDRAPDGVMSLAALYDALVERDIRLDRREARESGRLAYAAEAGAVTPALRAALTAHRRELLAALVAPAPAGPLPERPQCGWGQAHYHVWDYHAGWRYLICRICHPRAWDVPPSPPIPPASAWPDWTPTARDASGEGVGDASGAASETPDGGPTGGAPDALDDPTPPAPVSSRQRPRERPRGSSTLPAGEPRARWHGSRPADRLAVLATLADGAPVVWVENDAPGATLAYTRRAVELAPEDMPTPGACHAGALLALAARLQVAQLWIHPSWARRAGLPDRHAPDADADARREGVPHPFISDALADGWDIQPSGLASWMVGLRRGVWGRYALAYCEWDGSAPWRDAPDGATLLQALIHYRDALGGYAYRRRVGTTGTGLLRYLHTGAHTLDISASVKPSDFPAPALDGNAEWDMTWQRELTPDEAGRAWAHGYDKNAAYLGATSSLWLGVGEALHLSASGSTGADHGELAGLVAACATKDRLPGYWLASIAYTPPTGLPSPFTPDGLPSDAPRWLTTPSVELALKVGARVDVREAWVWRERHRPLEPWYKALREARETLAGNAAIFMERGELANARAWLLALDAVKATYRQSIGWLNGAWLRASATPEDLYRPDWRHAIIAQARANFTRAGLNVYRSTGRAPFRGKTDCWYYASETPDARADCPAALRLGDGLAEWKIKESGPLATITGATLADALASGAPKRSDVLARLKRERDAARNAGK